MEINLPYKTNKLLNLNCVQLRNGIKSLRKRHEITTFILQSTSYIKPKMTFNFTINKLKIPMKSPIKINNLQDLRLNLLSLHVFGTKPQPHMNLDLEGISIQLDDHDIDQCLNESTENNDLIYEMTINEKRPLESALVFTMYKRVDKKIKPVPASFPEDCYVTRNIPEDPLISLPYLSKHPPEFTPTKKITADRLPILKINEKGFLSQEEEKLFKHIMVLNEEAIAFEDVE
jgi:hypothetical protein